MRRVETGTKEVVTDGLVSGNPFRLRSQFLSVSNPPEPHLSCQILGSTRTSPPHLTSPVVPPTQGLSHLDLRLPLLTRSRKTPPRTFPRLPSQDLPRSEIRSVLPPEVSSTQNLTMVSDTFPTPNLVNPLTRTKISPV